MPSLSNKALQHYQRTVHVIEVLSAIKMFLCCKKPKAPNEFIHVACIRIKIVARQHIRKVDSAIKQLRIKSDF